MCTCSSAYGEKTDRPPISRFVPLNLQLIMSCAQSVPCKNHSQATIIQSPDDPEQNFLRRASSPRMCVCETRQPGRRTRAGRRGLAHAGRVAARVGDLLGQLLLGASAGLVVLLLVLHQDLPHQLHRARQRHAGLQLQRQGEKLTQSGGARRRWTCRTCGKHCSVVRF